MVKARVRSGFSYICGGRFWGVRVRGRGEMSCSSLERRVNVVSAAGVVVVKC